MRRTEEYPFFAAGEKRQSESGSYCSHERLGLFIKAVTLSAPCRGGTLPMFKSPTREELHYYGIVFNYLVSII